MHRIVRYLVVLIAAKAGFAALSALKNAPQAPRLLKWGAGLGLTLLPVKK